MPTKCKECIKNNPEWVRNARKDGLCQKHLSEKNGKVHPCRVCVDNYIEPPNLVTQGYCDDHKNTKHILKCTECIRLKRKKPSGVVSNNLCLEHGAEPPKCTVCKLEDPDTHNSAVKYGLCSEHYKDVKEKCEKCLELNITDPKDARPGQNLCIEHGAFVPDCKECLRLKLPKNLINKEYRKGLCRTHLK